MTLLTILYQLIPQEGIILYIFTAIRATASVFILEATFDMAPYILKNSKYAKYFITGVVLLLTVFNINIVYIVMLNFVIALVLTYRKKISCLL